MLAKFTEVEDLEGQIYACENCNSSKLQYKFPVDHKATFIHSILTNFQV